MTEQHHNQSDAGQLMQAILDTQANISRQTEAKAQLERQLAEINEQIANDITVVNELREALDKAIAQATNRAVEG